ncbi:MAG: hypothetical protein PWQ54_778 [Bacteroidales bacterium]|nr:hypothetical protein [Bacteroidales bacterium]
MHFDSSFAAQCNHGIIQEQKGIFNRSAALIRIHLISHLDLVWVVTEGRRAYAKRSSSRNKSPTTVQMSLF